MAHPGGDSDLRHRGFWGEVRNDPRHANEVTVRHAQAQVAPHVEMWWDKTHRARPSEAPERTAKRVLRRSLNVARRHGLITGSSFYLGMVPAVAMIYCDQLVLVLRIAAVYGRAPSDPLRAAEYLHIQNRYVSVHEAASALQKTGRPAQSGPATEVRSIAALLRQLPGMIGLQVRRLRARSLFDQALGIVEVASYFVPVISIPVWVFANAHATRRLGRAALAFYSQPADESEDWPALHLPARPNPRLRGLLFGIAVPLMLATGVIYLYFYIPLGGGLRWTGFAIGETAMALTFARLIRLTRMPRAQEGST